MPVNSIGNKGGIVVATLAAANHRYTFWFNTTTVTPNTVAVGGSEFPFGWKNFTLQLIPGNMSAGSVEIDTTLEMLTAQGTNSNWEPVPAQNSASGFSWFNPLANVPGQRLIHINSGPWLAFSALTSSDWVGTTATLIAAATA